ncbi:MAG: Gfo/Idh/MocA family oxidoreductase [Clostridia bacterium]|nr:Gfo/Idh/MocA family oxidoreductase [Clostridia bacterium]
MNACIVGYGAVGPVHAAAVDAIDGAKVYAVCDIDRGRAELCKEKYGSFIYSDFDEILKDENIDVVHICTPHYLHGRMAKAALLAGKHVALEKPVVLTMAELEELREIARSSAGRLAIMLQNRRNASITELKRITESGEYGELKGLIGGVYWKRDDAYYAQGEWRGRWQTEGGGAIINQSIHMLDMMIHLSGRIRNMRSSINRWKVESIEVEDTASALIEFESGVTGIFNATNCFFTDEPYMLEARFERGKFRYADGRLYRIDECGAEVIAKDTGVMVGKSYWGSGHFSLLHDFYSSIGGKDAPYTTVEDAYLTMKAVFDIYGEAGVPCPNNLH